ncbi:outer membrane protein OmpA-like peptidoglycan-associated protein [Mesonia hippocampi]|uniref:Outer membrane protein OmpA-like peptidoglycan-associated protein n=1 Tax=Mesonia hippocampi TaxID=1628250 RepID=A0A840F0T4_9FLAO|nr:OmpA family protein [Mesonia hippocampi]MBB4119874.1 outer membrane protein OmpA-like peptidoglycan-associated protein [Mesonia hippocampi]
MFKNLLFYSCLLGFLTTKAQVIPIEKIKFQQFYTLKDKSHVFIPLGNVAFADTIISFKEGNPKALPQYSNPQNAAGEPDYKKYLDTSYVSVGCKGQLVAQFKDNGFIDIEGPDLYFFEIGPSVEAFTVEISSDNKNWIMIGEVSGGKSSADIANANLPANKKDIYYYVRLTDLGSFCRGPTPGADIDAIATVGGVLKLNVSAHLLFDTDKAILKTSAINELERFIVLISEIPKAKILVSGHTDSDASYDYNMKLGDKRARAVKKYLSEQLKDKGTYLINTESFGETMPIASNKTAKGKQQNRRVEILVLPDKSFYIPPAKK